MPPGRPRHFDRDAALEAAMQLFWEKGFGATSLDDLLRTIGISRSSFYAAFQSKEAIFREALSLYQRLNYQALQEQLKQSPSGLAFIRFILEIPVGEAEGSRPSRGCLLMNTASELGGSHQGFDREVTHSLGTFEKIFRNAVERAVEDGEFPVNTDPVAMATALSASLGGLRTLAKSGTPPKKIRAAVEAILKAFSE